MTCHDARDLFSALADQALEPLERSQLDEHFAICTDCRRELDRFERAVGALRALVPARAPVGFVDRVLTATRSEPWHRRLLRGLFLPLRVKVPLEAMALVLAAAAAVYVLERSPELRQATSPQERPPEVSSADRSPAPAIATESPPGERSRAAEARRPDPQRGRADKAEGDAPHQKAEPEQAVTPLEKVKEESRLAPSPEPSAPMPQAPASVGREATARKDARRSTELDAAAKPTAPPGVIGFLTVTDPRAAETALAALLGRLGAEEVSRRAEQGHTVVEILIAGSRYAELAEGLERIGVWTVEREPERAAERILVTVRIKE